MKQYLPLFDDDEDAKSIQPRKMKDDVEFQKERRRNRKKPGHTPDPPQTGPCCFRCRHWRRPARDDEEFGRCRVLGVAGSRNPAYHIEKGEVHDAGFLDAIGVPSEALRTGPSFRCSAYQMIEEKAA